MNAYVAYQDTRMTVLALAIHLVGFLAPALLTGCLLWVMARGWRYGRKGRRVLLWLCLAGAAVLVAGLIGFGRDGKIATYAAMVLAQGTIAWWWRGRSV